jgi:hypothetical protein
MKRFRCRHFLALLLALGATQAGATTLLRMSLDELAAAAGVIARVRCIGIESRIERGEIWTFNTFEVLDPVKGSVPRFVTVRLLGGKVGHLISTVDGVPKFHPEEEAYLFLERNRAGDFNVTSWAQGTFRIRRDPNTGQESITQDSSALPVFDAATGKYRVEGVRNMPVRQFHRQLREIVERQRMGGLR